MSLDMTHVEFARENEDFADNIDSDYDKKGNWVITIRFYSIPHYIEERLEDLGFNSRTHSDRKQNIRESTLDNRLRSCYRMLEDLSRDARYECIRMGEDEIDRSEEVLKEAKDILGFGSDTSSAKYSI